MKKKAQYGSSVNKAVNNPNKIKKAPLVNAKLASRRTALAKNGGTLKPGPGDTGKRIGKCRGGC
jgi:hypothetical protein